MRTLFLTLFLAVGCNTFAAPKISPKTAADGSPSAVLEWDPRPESEHVTYYEVWEHIGPAAADWRMLGMPTVTKFDLTNLTPGTHSYAVAAANADGQGPRSVEVSYTVKGQPPGAPENPRITPVTPGIANVSTRAQVGVGDNVMIGGFIIQGATTPVIVRAVGASLQSAGINGALIDPTLEVRNSHGELVALNDNWQSDPAQKTALQDIGLAPTDYREAAISLALDPGAYTAIVRGKSNTTGVALVEVYRG